MEKNHIPPRFLAALVLLALFAGGCAAGRIIALPDRNPVEFSSLVEDLRGRRVVFVGEVHDSPAHHRMQLQVINAMRRAGADFAVGLEMFTRESQEALDNWVGGKIDKADFLEEYAKNWQAPWRLYKPIFLHARDYGIPLIGLNVSRDVIHRVFTGGLESLTQEEKEFFGPLECDVDERYAGVIREAIEEHDEVKGEFKNFCAAQMAWDIFMAKSIIEYLEKNPGRSMVVLSGNAHSWKRGIPRRLKERTDMSFVVVIPEMPEDIDRINTTKEDADYLWLEK